MYFDGPLIVALEISIFRKIWQNEHATRTWDIVIKIGQLIIGIAKGGNDPQWFLPGSQQASYLHHLKISTRVGQTRICIIRKVPTSVHLISFLFFDGHTQFEEFRDQHFIVIINWTWCLIPFRCSFCFLTTRSSRNGIN